ncbi:putative non-ribosomal peptide synthase-like protein [Phaeosphaeria sp. MPI-PUGE-AT-0046c]|nr:putative non-ribosomal peptide synthase-like protein [Phaeosphaeria sp. MPI-PUGE-AT-0046c]
MESFSNQSLPTDVVSISRGTDVGESSADGEDHPKTLLSLLRRAAQSWPTHGIMFKDQGWDEVSDFVTYPDLLRQAEINAAKLLAHGTIKPNQCILLYFDTHRDNVIWYWSTVAAGGVPALLSPLSSNDATLVGELQNVSELFNGPTVLTSKRLAKPFRQFPSLNTVTAEIISTTRYQESIGTKSIDAGISHPDELATVLFTSGSTGFAKGVEYTHTQLLMSSKLKCTFHHMDSNKTFLSWVSFDHSAALCENHLHALYAGANQVMIPAMDFVQHPARFWKALSDHCISYTFAPNFFIAAAVRALNNLDYLERREMRLDFSQLRVIMCGGEANKTATLQAAESILTEYGALRCSIKASYGLSETCSAVFYNIQSPAYDIDRKYAFASVGKLLPQHELRIVDESGASVKNSQTGTIQIRGPLIFKRYLNNESATSACMTPDGWFDTGDLGMLDDESNLRIVGRSKEVLIINGQNYSSFELEHAIESANIPGLNKSFTASFSIWLDDEDGESEEVVILFNPTNDNLEDTPELRDTVSQINEAVIRFCRKRPAIVVPLPQHKLPKSTIGKLSRAKLKKSLLAGHFDQYKLSKCAPQSLTQRGLPLSTALQKALSVVLCAETGMKDDDLHLNIVLADLNINSLGYLRIKSSLEKLLELDDSLSMSSLLSCRTIADMDNMLLLEGTTTVEYDPIVPLVSSGSKTPMILCHPGGGEFLTWLTLLKHIPDRPVYALRVRGFHKSETPFETLDEMLDTYIAGIRLYQPKGPYILLGLCFGGMLAFELTKRLEAAGEEVAFCGGIDNPPDLTRIQVRAKPRNFIIDLLHFFQLLDVETALQWEREMDNVPDEKFTGEIFRRFPDGTLENLDLTVSKVEAWQRINDNMQAITRSYVPTGSVSKYDLFWVPPLPQYDCTDQEWRHDWLAKWEKYVTNAKHCDVENDGSEGPLRYHRVEGTHFTILRPENIEVFQKALNAALQVRGV